MKIAYIGQKGIPMTQGGVEAHVENLSIAMAKKNHDVFVYTRPHYTSQKLKEYQGVKLISLPSIKTKHLDAITHTFLASIHALFQGYDIIHYHAVGPSLFSFIPRLFSQAKVIGTFHCIDRFHQKWGFLARLILRIGEWAVCKFPHTTISVSPHIKKYCAKEYQKETLYIPNGFKIDQNFAHDILKKYNLSPQKYFLAVSRIIQHKGLHYLIKAFQKLNNPEYKLVIVGDTFYNQKYQKDLNQLAGDREDIIFTGLQKEEALDKLFTNAFSFVLPSEDEGLSITLLEALAHQLPTIVSNIEANTHFIEKGLVYSFENKNIEDLRGQMQYVLSHPEKNQIMIKKAHNYIKNNFSWNFVSNEIDKVYFSSLNEKAMTIEEAYQKMNG